MLATDFRFHKFMIIFEIFSMNVCLLRFKISVYFDSKRFSKTQQSTEENEKSKTRTKNKSPAS